MSDDRSAEQRPLRLLALDGGGIRGYSELKILQVLMHRIAWDMNVSPKDLRPCDYFDLIGGTSTGGIIAVLLGRLRLTVEECIEQYAQLSQKIFGNERWSIWGMARARYDAKALENVIIEVLKDRVPKTDLDGKRVLKEILDTNGKLITVPEMVDMSDATLLDDNEYACKAFVTATSSKEPERNKPRLFRTYQPAKRTHEIPPETKIWQAVRATSAAPTFFDSIQIGEEIYVDGGFGCNNPAPQVYQEAKALWPNREIACLISLGTGMPHIRSMQDPSVVSSLLPIEMLRALERIATQCEATHRDIVVLKELKGKYFRFNVRQGMQTITLAEWKKLGEVGTHTEQYLRDVELQPELEKAIARMRLLEKTENEDFEEIFDD